MEDIKIPRSGAAPITEKLGAYIDQKNYRSITFFNYEKGNHSFCEANIFWWKPPNRIQRKSTKAIHIELMLENIWRF